MAGKPFRINKGQDRPPGALLFYVVETFLVIFSITLKIIKKIWLIFVRH